MDAESENLTQFIVNHCVLYLQFTRQNPNLMEKGNIYESISELFDY